MSPGKSEVPIRVFVLSPHVTIFDIGQNRRIKSTNL